MNARFPGLLCGMLLLACCGGCASTRLPADLFDDQGDVAAPDPSFQAGMDYLTSTNDTPTGWWRAADDWVLLGVKATRHGRTDVWFVRISTHPMAEASGSPRFKAFMVPVSVGPLTAKSLLIAPVGRICIELFDQNGASVHTSIGQIPAGMTFAGLLDLCKAMAIDPTAVESEPSSEHAQELATLLIALQAIGECRSMKPIRDAAKADIIDMPGVLSLLMAGFQLKPEMALRQGAGKAGAVASPFNAPWDEAVFQLRVAGQPLLNGRLVSRTPQPPYHLTGGMLVLETAHPERPQHRLTLRVLAARHN